MKQDQWYNPKCCLKAQLAFKSKVSKVSKKDLAVKDTEMQSDGAVSDLFSEQSCFQMQQQVP